MLYVLFVNFIGHFIEFLKYVMFNQVLVNSYIENILVSNYRIIKRDGPGLGSRNRYKLRKVIREEMESICG